MIKEPDDNNEEEEEDNNAVAEEDEEEKDGAEDDDDDDAIMCPTAVLAGVSGGGAMERGGETGSVGMSISITPSDTLETARDIEGGARVAGRDAEEEEDEEDEDEEEDDDESLLELACVSCEGESEEGLEDSWSTEMTSLSVVMLMLLLLLLLLGKGAEDE